MSPTHPTDPHHLAHAPAPAPAPDGPGHGDPEAALRGLCRLPAAAFGARLLARADGPLIPFRDFVLTARDLVDREPDAAATWLAALVALDMRGAPARPQTVPSTN